jgi:integrase
VDAKGLRSKEEIVRHLKIVNAEWARTPFFEIRRKTVNALLDKIAVERSPLQADAVLATLRSIMNWYATRDDEYTSPIVKGMHRDHRKASDRARRRILNDDELRALWAGADQVNGAFGAIVKLLLLTAQRREKVATMKWADVQDGIWTIATEAREKGNAGQLRLPAAALEIIAAQPVIDDNPHVFPGSPHGPWREAARSRPPSFNSWSQRKAEIDAALPPMPNWTLHDLRRTARSLMSRVGVSSDIAERVMGHAIAGVEGVYDRHSYAGEKADALNKLATLIEQIVNPPDQTNVVPLALGCSGRR